MRITRNGHHIELTAEELEAAYREQQRNYQREDVAEHIASLFDEDIEVQEHLQKCGITPQELMADTHFADLVIEHFTHDFDCNIDENTMWRTAIINAISQLGTYFDAILIQIPNDHGISAETAIRLIQAMKEEDELIPIIIEGENAWTFGYMRLAAFDEILHFDAGNDSPFGIAVRDIIDDMRNETDNDFYCCAGVKTRIVYSL